MLLRYIAGKVSFNLNQLRTQFLFKNEDMLHVSEKDSDSIHGDARISQIKQFVRLVNLLSKDFHQTLDEDTKQSFEIKLKKKIQESELLSIAESITQLAASLNSASDNMGTKF